MEHGAVMVTASLVLRVLGLVFFGLATAGVPARVSWEPAGLFCWLLSTLVP